MERNTADSVSPALPIDSLYPNTIGGRLLRSRVVDHGQFTEATHRRLTALFVDNDSPRNTSDGDGDNGLLSSGIDDGDVVTKAIGDEKLALVLGKCNAP